MVTPNRLIFHFCSDLPNDHESYTLCVDTNIKFWILCGYSPVNFLNWTQLYPGSKVFQSDLSCRSLWAFITSSLGLKCIISPLILFISRESYLRSMQAAIPLLCPLLNIKLLLLLMRHEADRTSSHRDAAAAILIHGLRVTTQGCQIHGKMTLTFSCYAKYYKFTNFKIILHYNTIKILTSQISKKSCAPLFY